MYWIIGFDRCVHVRSVWFSSANPFSNLLQSETPKELTGRVSAAAMALQKLAMLFAPAAGSIISNWICPASVLVLQVLHDVLGAIAAFYKPSLSPKHSGIRKSQGHPL
ncbi:hypothetical protein [Bacillus sp. V2I10]|uniref:hypothetical protein n=1 Tax=Bacillus sp. V2I10 TaxID=3042276 RepID=UPI002786F99F|nr:hypothetical protein [Bacillus sp. V2I10]MDQ0859550.1 hypothetical protein [Bacillus sp. V2I10]